MFRKQDSLLELELGHNMTRMIRGVLKMKNKWYGLYAALLGIVSIFTGEIVTFVMLGFILIALININTTLKMNFKKDDRQNDGVE